jgi:catechol 2,3-dioxygenase-like lactoylglutathione lyase family enzyme
VADIERAKGFWAKVGFSPGSERPGGVEYEMGGGSSFTIYLTGNPNRGGHTQLHFRVTDIESEVADLKAGGVVFEEYDSRGLKTENSIATTGSGKGAWFKDEDGNTIGIFQPK